MGSIALDNCSTMHDLQSLLKEVKGPIIGKGGGRKFEVQAAQVSMNTLVHKYFELLKKSTITLKSANDAAVVANTLEKLNHMPLPKLTAKQQKTLEWRQKWGNKWAKFKWGFSHKNLKETAYQIFTKNFTHSNEEILIPVLKDVRTKIQKKKIPIGKADDLIERGFAKAPSDEILKKFSGALALASADTKRINDQEESKFKKRIAAHVSRLKKLGVALHGLE